VVVKTSEQMDAQAKAFASMAVGFFEHSENFSATNDVLREYALAGQSAIVSLLLGGERDGLASAFMGRAAVRVPFGQTLVAAVGEQFDARVRMQLAALEEPEIVLSAWAAGHRQERARGFVDGHLAFQRVALLLARVAGALFFFGRSRGLSVTSPAMTGHGGSAPAIFRRPGSAHAPFLTSVFSTRWMVRRTVFSAPGHAMAQW
jgi:hypothetical protein